jgi:hypothetical protein
MESNWPDFRIKEALLRALGGLSTEIAKDESLHSKMEPLLKEHVVNELTGG